MLENNFYCDCPESSEALGMEVPSKARNWYYEHDQKVPYDVQSHQFTKTQVFKDDRCKFCGSYAILNRKERL